MDSKSLEEYGFKQWYSWKKLTSSGLPFEEPGIYVIKSMTTEPRKRGDSDILYIGSSGNLLNRIFKNYLFGIGGSRERSTTQRIYKKLFKEGYLDKTEISWVTSENYDKLEKYLEGIIKWPSRTKNVELEKRLKLKFERDHDGWPPWNKRL